MTHQLQQLSTLRRFCFIVTPVPQPIPDALLFCMLLFSTSVRWKSDLHRRPVASPVRGSQGPWALPNSSQLS